MMQALTEKDYNVQYAWGMNKQRQKMGRAILPEMVCWLWRDHQFASDPKDTVERRFIVPGKAVIR